MTDTFLQAPTSYYDEFVDPLIPVQNAFFIRAEHLMRYVFAKKFIQKKRAKIVYDVACGDGYGAKILSSATEHVYGFDVSEALLSVAKKQYAAKNIAYIRLDLDKSSLDQLDLPRPDAVVSFETLEHVEDPQKLLQLFYNNLPSSGYLLLSTPNAKLEPKKKGKSRNKFHKHIFEQEELVSLLQVVGFEVENIYGQAFANILFHNKLIRDILNKITVRSLFLFKIFSYLGHPNKLFLKKSYSMVIVASKK